MASSRDRRTLATADADADADGSVILRDITDPCAPEQLGDPLTGHGEGVSAVAFSPDGRTLATAIEDVAVPLWDLSGLIALQEHAMERTYAMTGGGLTRAEWARYVPGLEYVDVCAT